MIDLKVVTNVNESISAPLIKKNRILFLDSVRGIALLGILLMNINAQGQAYIFYDKLDLSQSITGANFWVWVAEMGFFEGTMRGIFSILFGAGSYLLIKRLEKQYPGLEPADIYYRRVLWLLFFGLVNAFLFLWPGDILYPYALCGLLIFPFRNLSPKILLFIAFLLIAFGTYRENRMLFDRKETIVKGKLVEGMEKKKQKLTEEQKGELAKYKGFKEKKSSTGYMNEAKMETQKVQGKNYAEIFEVYRDENMQIQSVFFYNSWWDILLFFFIGMALLKSGFMEGKMNTGIYLTVMILGIAAGLWFNYQMMIKQYQYKFDGVILTEKVPFVVYQLRRVMQTLGYLSMFILMYKVNIFRRIMDVFAPVGQMAFTNYLMQSIITSILFFGFGLFGTLQRYELYYVVALIWIFQIILSHIWLRYFYFGPFEWVWRSLTYLKKPAFLKKRQGLEGGISAAGG
jgi:uncharacterized protein